MYIGQVMTRKVITVSPGEKVRRAFGAMLGKRIAHLPVVENGKITGIVSDRDLRKAIASMENSGKGKRGKSLCVGDVMTSDVVTASADMGVADAVGLILRLGIGSLPIVEEGRLKGIITKDDLLGVFVEMLRAIQDSATIDVELADEIDDTDTVLSVLRKRGAAVLSCSARPGGKAGKQVCHFRLKLCPVKPIVRDLKKKGVRVLEAYGDD